MLLERHEEEVVEALQNDAFTTPAGGPADGVAWFCE
jgi:hypothetical protein